VLGRGEFARSYVRWTSPISYAAPASSWARPRPSLLSGSRWTTGRCHGGSAAGSAPLHFVAGKELIRASPILKLVAPIDDLKHPCVISKGVRLALKRAGIPDHDLSTPLEVQAGTSPELSGAHALDVIQADPAWVNKRAAYAEAHCIAPRLGTWVDAMLIPLPDEPLALTEFIPSSPEGGFWVRVVRFEDMRR